MAYPEQSQSLFIGRLCRPVGQLCVMLIVKVTSHVTSLVLTATTDYYRGLVC